MNSTALPELVQILHEVQTECCKRLKRRYTFKKALLSQLPCQTPCAGGLDVAAL